MTRPVLPRQREGRLERIVDECLGDGAAEMIKRGCYGNHAFVPVAGGQAWAHDGELWPRIAGASPFADFNDLVASMSTSSLRQDLTFTQPGTTAVIGRGLSLWNTSGRPAAGSAPSGLAGNALDRTNTGALGQANPAGADTLHSVAVPAVLATAIPQLLILYDRIMHWRPTTTSGAQTLTGTPGRYQTTALATGNFMFAEIATVLPATAHTPTYTYTDESGNTGATVSPAGISSGAANTTDHAGWFITPASGDKGARNITAYNVGTTLASGAINVVLGHPIAYMPIMVANAPYAFDMVNSVMGMAEILTDACLNHIAYPGVTTATTYTGTHTFAES